MQPTRARTPGSQPRTSTPSARFHSSTLLQTPPERITLERSPQSTLQDSRSPRSATSPGMITSYRRTGQGPFKISQSQQRALFGLEKATRELELYMARVDPEAANCLNESVRASQAGRAVLSEVRAMLHWACAMQASAAKNIELLKRDEAGPVHKDPRRGMRDALARQQREAHEAMLTLEDQEANLLERVLQMRGCCDILHKMTAIYSNSVSRLPIHVCVALSAQVLAQGKYQITANT